ncbi:hypothetical protein [Jeotgalibacillus aurantiacus]|uniref:hypothetical protein n=1 Tax=Jeotgalibacillus aurantiacus TaxID=2763266 RepID=UPI001D0B22DB|nr:hypothetical protein [Jeotgalibacillus aurantiacus]
MRKPYLFAGIFSVVLAISAYFVYEQMVPDDFLTEEELLKNFSLVEQDRTIQNVMKVDDRTYFVPYTTGNQSYGTSIWVWTNGDWQNVGDGTTEGLSLLKTDSGEEYVYWNVRPENGVNHWSLSMKFDRNYLFYSLDGMEQQEIYYPETEIVELIEVGDTSYGITMLSDKWRTFADISSELGADAGILPSTHSFLYEWQAFDQDGNITSVIEASGGSYMSGSYVTTLPQAFEDELEE